MDNKVVIVDFDNCIAGKPGESTSCSALSQAEPNWLLLTSLFSLKASGYTLVLFSARGMNRTNGQLASKPAIAQQVVQEITNWFEQNTSFSLLDLFDSVELFKPYGIAYIDDKAVPSSIAHLASPEVLIELVQSEAFVLQVKQMLVNLSKPT